MVAPQARDVEEMAFGEIEVASGEGRLRGGPALGVVFDLPGQQRCCGEGEDEHEDARGLTVSGRGLPARARDLAAGARGAATTGLTVHGGDQRVELGRRRNVRWPRAAEDRGVELLEERRRLACGLRGHAFVPQVIHQRLVGEREAGIEAQAIAQRIVRQPPQRGRIARRGADRGAELAGVTGNSARTATTTMERARRRRERCEQHQCNEPRRAQP